MPIIKNIQRKYFSKISPSDLEILISYAIGKPKEFTLAHPEYKLSPYQVLCIKYYVWQRSKKRPIAYITRHKEFYGLDFKVNKNVLIPRPETEQIVERGTRSIKRGAKKTIIIDIGTGCGNIIISVAKNLPRSMLRAPRYAFYASDISEKALRVAKQNAKRHKVENKIKFLQGDLLKPFIKNKIFKIQNSKFKILVIANLPYLSRRIYDSAPADVKKYEPKSALYSKHCGLAHYEKLFAQIKSLVTSYELPVTAFLEFSPEQKNRLAKLIKNYFPRAKIIFHKDLAGKWRVCEINITPEKSALV